MTDQNEHEKSAVASGSRQQPVVSVQLDRNYHAKNLKRLLRDLDNYTADEYSRALLRLVCVADPIVMTEREFVQQRLKAISEMVNGEPILPGEIAH